MVYGYLRTSTDKQTDDVKPARILRSRHNGDGPVVECDTG